MKTAKQIISTATAAAVLASIVLGPALPTRAADAPTTSPTTQPEATGAERFYGAVTAVDATAKTFTVGDQTFNVGDESHLTKAADDSAITLADVTVGEPARGTYTKSADGKLNIAKVRFGKRTGGKSGGSGGKKKKGGEATTQPDAPQ